MSAITLHAALEALMARYGAQHWWPADTRFEIAAGAILVQHATWRNADIALENLRSAGLLGPAAVCECSSDSLEQMLRPSGTFRLKSARLKAIARWWLDCCEEAAAWSTGALRDSLLKVGGIGPETADCILLYAFDRPAFVADAYARRWLHRMGWTPIGGDYASVQAHAMSNLRHDSAFLNEAHALIVAHGQGPCRARRPRCDACCLTAHCDYAAVPA